MYRLASFVLVAGLLLTALSRVAPGGGAVFVDAVNVSGNIFSTGDWTDVQSGVATSTGNGTVTASISPVDTSKAFLIFQTRSNSNRPPGSMVRGRILNSTTVEFARVTDESSTINIRWYVVADPDINVQRGETTQDSTAKDQAITPVASLTQAFVTWSKTPNSADSAWSSDDPILAELTSTSNIQFRSQEGSGHIIWWQVIEYANPADVNVQKGTTSMSTTTTSVNATLGTPVDVTKTFVLAGYTSTSSSTEIGQRLFRAQLINSTTIQIDRSVAGGAVSRISTWTTGLTHNVGSGSGRLLVFAVSYENDGDPGVSSVTYGGQGLTRIAGAVAGTTTNGRVELWYLNEAGISAASGNTFGVVWGGAAPSYPMYAAASFANVNQATPILNSSTNFTDASTPNPITTSVTTTTNAMTVAGAIAGNDGSYSWNNGWTERTDQTSGSTTTMSTSEKSIASGTSETASATHSGPNRQAIVAATLNPASGEAISEIVWQAVELKDGSTVQRGSETFGTGVSQRTPSISSVITQRSVAFASFQPAAGQSMGRSPYVGDDIIGVCSVTMALASTSITMDRNNTASSCDVGWFVIQFAP